MDSSLCCTRLLVTLIIIINNSSICKNDNNNNNINIKNNIYNIYLWISANFMLIIVWDICL